MREASRSVDWSPSITATFAELLHRFRVISKIVVLPAPGAPIKLIAKILCAAKCERLYCAAASFEDINRWFRSILRIAGELQPQVSHIFHLDCPKYHCITGQEFSAQPSASRASANHIVELKNHVAIQALAARS